MMRNLSFILVFILSINVVAQISPPGLGHTKTASWVAVGVKEKVSEKWQMMSYFGVGRVSGSTINPFKSSSILVVNQEFFKQLKKGWKYSFAISGRSQNKNISSNNQSLQQKELRLYGRFSKSFILSRVKITPTVRQEVRKFFLPKSLTDYTDLALRSRFRLQASFSLDEDQSKKIIVSSEQLFSIENPINSNDWGDFNYHESRFLLYYSTKSKSSPVTFDIGYMNNLVGGAHPYDASYIAIDIVFG